MSSRAKKASKNPHNIPSTPTTQSESKLNQKRLKFDNKSSQSKNDIPVKNDREKRISLGSGAVQKDSTNNEKSRLYYSSDEEPDDINITFEQNVSKSIQSFPRKSSDMHFKDRKFFKRNYPETFTPSVCLSPRTVELQEENVSKVFKMLSKSASTSFSESKSVKKLPLKTYSTPKTTKPRIIESFGLPDNPIVSSLPTQYDDLDVGITDAKDVTVFDLSFYEVEEVLPIKQYEKSLSSSVSNVENQDETSQPHKNTSPDHSVLIEKMKSQIRKLLSDSPTHLKDKSTSTPIKKAKLDKLTCDISFIDSNSVDMEIFNTSGRTDILFSPPILSYNKRSKSKSKTNVSESEKFRQKLRSSESCDEGDKTENYYKKKLDTSNKKNNSRSRSKKPQGSKSTRSSFSTDASDESCKKQTSIDKGNSFSKVQSPNKSLELKVVLSPLSKSMLSNYPEHQNLDNCCIREKTNACVQFLEHEQHNVFAPVEMSIVNKILGDWESTETDFVPISKKKSRFIENSPNHFNSACGFDELSPDFLKDKLKYNKKCRGAVALLSEQDNIMNKPKKEVSKEPELIDAKKVLETKNEIALNYLDQDAKKEEKSFIDTVEDRMNFSIIHYESLEKDSGSAQDQEILIFETPNNLELITNKENIIKTVDSVDINEMETQDNVLIENTNLSIDKDLVGNEIKTIEGISQSTKSLNDECNNVNLCGSKESLHSIKSDSFDSSNKNKGNITCDNDTSNIVIKGSNFKKSLDIPVQHTDVVQNDINNINHQNTKENLPQNENSKSTEEICENVNSELPNESRTVCSKLLLSKQRKSSKLVEAVGDGKRNHFGKQFDIVLKVVNTENLHIENSTDNKKKNNVKKQLTKSQSSIHLEESLNADNENEITVNTEETPVPNSAKDFTDLCENAVQIINNECNISLPNTTDCVKNNIEKPLQVSILETILLNKNGDLKDSLDTKKTKLVQNNSKLHDSVEIDTFPIHCLDKDAEQTKHSDQISGIEPPDEPVSLTNLLDMDESFISSCESCEEIFENIDIENMTDIKRKHHKKSYTKCRSSLRLEKFLIKSDQEKVKEALLKSKVKPQTNDSIKDDPTDSLIGKTELSTTRRQNNRETDETTLELQPTELISERTELLTTRKQRIEERRKTVTEKIIENDFQTKTDNSEPVLDNVKKESLDLVKSSKEISNIGDTQTIVEIEPKEISYSAGSQMESSNLEQKAVEFGNKLDNNLSENIGIDKTEDSLVSPIKGEMTLRKRERLPKKENITTKSNKLEESIKIQENIESEQNMERKEIQTKEVDDKNVELKVEVNDKSVSESNQAEQDKTMQNHKQKEIDDIENLLASPRKRGKPRKNLTNLETSSETPSKSAEMSLDEHQKSPNENVIKADTRPVSGEKELQIENQPIVRRRGRPPKKKRKSINKIISQETVEKIAISDKNRLVMEEALNNASPKIFEGFENVEQPKEVTASASNSLKSIHNIDLEQIEAELAAIECQREEEKYILKLTRSKSRAALTVVKDEVTQVQETDVKTLKRSKTSLGLLLKEPADDASTATSRGRQRTRVDLIELETSKEKRNRSKSVAPSTMKMLPQKKAIKDEKEKSPVLKLGTLAWARIGGYPFWPCLITKEAESNIFKKDSHKYGTVKIVYHVRFFGDKGKRAWVWESKMMSYNNKNDVEALLQKLKREKKPASERLPYIIRSLYLKKWQKAVNEAEQLKGKTLSEKLDFFEQLDKRRKLEKLARRIDLPGSSKRKRGDSMSTISSETSQITDFQDVSPTRKRYKKNDGEVVNKNRASWRKDKQDEKDNNKQETATPSTKDNSKSEPEPVVIPPYVPILDNENILPSRTRSGLHSDANSDIVSKVSSEKSEKLEVSDPFSTDAQRALFKRNNLFKGVSKEKACQYCYQAGMVFKCSKGGCNGLYHLRCSIDVMSGEEYNKKKSKKKASSQSTVADQVQKETESNTSSNTESSEKNPPEDRVQIVTVASHIHNTPPRKTFPENFQGMSLAEQIDYKMKEIMKKFENETHYAESSTDSSSEENSVAKMMSRIKNSPSLRLTFDHLTAERKLSEDSIGGIILNKPNGKLSEINNKKPKHHLVKHVTADSVLEMSSAESSPSTTRQSFVRHVTADSAIEIFDKNNKAKTNLKKIVTSESDLERTPSESSLSTLSQLSKEVVIDPKNFKCGFCLSKLDPYCFVCHKAVTLKGSSIRQKCSLYQCGRYYHPECLKLWPQAQWSFIQTTKHRTSKEEFDTFVCPQHVCHTCSSDDPRAATSRCSGDKIVKCLRCPASYHSTNFCIPAGTEIISTTQVICPRHRDKNKATINTTWCFLCSEGGNLICCETCPTSVHPECMPVNLTDDDKFICEDCESGRLPLYDEIVWVKLGSFRWWPALILFPNEVPPNVMNARHSPGEFVVRFFGTYDHYWVSRSRSFLFQDGDAGQTTSTKKKVDEAFNRAVEEAVVAHKAKKEFKRTREVESLNSLKPPPYIRIKVNKPVGNVRQMDLDLSSTTSCDCDPNKPNPCEPDSDCLNRLLMTECNPEVCPAGQRCKNQAFEKREYPPMTPYKTVGRGWGLKTLAPIKKGQFVIEYVGELIDMEEYQRRIQKMHEQKEENYYFLTIDKDRMIDAGPKGNMARFMNHCCQPNCETQKWTVNGDTRVGLFATVDIPAETELTFNYNLECVGKERKICRCGAPSCSGFIGVQKEKDTEVRKIKKVHKKKKPIEQAILPPCFICQRKGYVGLCNNKVCNKAYHLRCLTMTEWPEGNTFICPRHNCNICEKRTIRCCVKCVNSFCPSHSDGNIRYDNLLGFVCSCHDPTKPHTDNPLRVRARKSHIITEESAVTSTTSDDSEKEDNLPLSEQLKTDDKKELDDIPLLKRGKKGKKRTSNNASVSEEELEVSVSNSTSMSDVQDEDLVSSATCCTSDETKRKKSVKKNDQTRKKIRLSNIVNNKKRNTARNNLNYRQLDDR